MKSFRHVSALLLGLWLWTGCSEEREQELDPQGAARVNVFLVDAPAAFDEVWVEVVAVELRPRQNGPEHDERAGFASLMKMRQQGCLICLR
ncbi:DUF4382 domain-containing protein [Nitritalea halalkaliphila]|nr:hypothetical protein [Nitritalea halalkaliphila]